MQHVSADLAQSVGKCYLMIGCVTSSIPLKYQDDIAKAQGSEAARILDEVKRAAGGGAT